MSNHQQTHTSARSDFPIFIHGLGAYPDRELSRRIEQRLQAEFGRTRGAIELVRVSVEDVNGPRGGIDDACRIVVQLPRRGCVAVSGRGTHLLAVVSRTAARAAQAVKRRFQRQRTRRRRTQLAS